MLAKFPFLKNFRAFCSSINLSNNFFGKSRKSYTDQFPFFKNLLAFCQFFEDKMSKTAAQDPLPQTVHGYVVHVSKSLEKTSTAPDGFFRFKLQVSQEQIKSVVCFNLKLLPELEVAVTENIGRQFTGMRKPKSENTIVLGQSSTMMPKVVDFAKMPYEHDHSRELLENFTTHIIAITCPIDSRNESSFFRLKKFLSFFLINQFNY